MNQLSTSTSIFATLLGSLRPLLSTQNDFMWSAVQEEAMIQVKKSLTTLLFLSFFDINQPTRLFTDTSRQGLGFILQQKHTDKWIIIPASSHFFSEVETRYAVIELQMLAVSWAVMKCQLFPAGLQILMSSLTKTL